MAKTNVAESEEMFKLRFIKLGFDERKSQVAKFNKDRIQKRLEQISLPESGTIPLEVTTLDEVKTETKKLVSTLYQGVGLRIDLFEDESQKPNQELIRESQRLNMLYKLGKITIADVTNNMLKMYQRIAKKAKIFDIPIKPAEGMDSMQGQTTKGPLIMIGDTVTMAKETPIYMESIYLGDKYDKLSIGTYMHEITHALLDRHKGIVENYYNDEFLSIFMEKVSVDQIDTSSNNFLVKCSEVYRLANVKKLLGKVDMYKESSPNYKDSLKYIQSSLYAGILFDRYSKATDVQKKAVLDQIKLVLNGKIKLNDFIKNQQLTIEGEEVFEYIDKIERYATELNERRKTELDFEASKMSTEEMQMKAVTDGAKIASELQLKENSQTKDG